MRRVYYAYVLLALVHPAAVRLYLLGLSGFILIKLVHVAAVWQSFSAIPVGQIGDYVLTTVVHADWQTLATLFFIGVILASFRLPVPKHTPRWAV